MYIYILCSDKFSIRVTVIGNNNVNQTICKNGNKKYNEKYICCFFTIFLFRTSIYFTIIKLILPFSYSFHIPCIILSKVYFIFPFLLIDRNRKQVLLIKCFIFVLKLKKILFPLFNFLIMLIYQSLFRR